MSGWYILGRSGSSQYYAILKSVHGDTILYSDTFSSSSQAEHAVRETQSSSQLDDAYERRLSSRGEPYFVLKSPHGQVIGTSPLFSSSFTREIGVSAVKLHGATSAIIDNTAPGLLVEPFISDPLLGDSHV